MANRIRASLAFFRSKRFARLAAILLLVGLILAGVGVIGLEAWADYQRRAAEKALERQDYAEARRHLELALRARPGLPVLHLLAGRTARQAGDFASAEEHLRKCHKLQGAWSEELQLEQLMLRAQQGEAAAVTDELSAYVKQGRPEAPLILEALCQGLLHEQMVGPALRCAEMWLERQPDNVQALFTHGWCLAMQGGYELAIADFEKALERAPDRDDIRQDLALALIEKQAYRKALTQLERLRGARRESASVQLNLARCHNALGRPEQARVCLDRLLEQEPRNPEILMERGKLALDRNRPQDAEKWLRRAVELAPHDHAASYQLLLCLRQLGRKEDADKLAATFRGLEADLQRIQQLMRAGMQSPARSPYHCHELGALLLRRGREQEALFWLYGGLKVAPNYRPIHALLAEHWRKAGDEERAAQHRLALRGQ